MEEEKLDVEEEKELEDVEEEIKIDMKFIYIYRQIQPADPDDKQTCIPKQICTVSLTVSLISSRCQLWLRQQQQSREEQ